jgi:hypothetical protein
MVRPLGKTGKDGSVCVNERAHTPALPIKNKRISEGPRLVIPASKRYDRVRHGV